jgi:cytochrome b pre-mRNA-processing protein 3
MAFNLFGLLGRGRTERTGYELYAVAVAAARQPYFYAELGVPDTLDGRFDMVGLHAFLLIRRLTEQPASQPLAQAVFDAMFNDMDVNLREMGVSDLSVGKKNKVMWEAFHGRSQVYTEAMMIGPEALAEALERNIWPGEQRRHAAINLARMVYAQDAHLHRLAIEAITSGTGVFLPLEEAFA